MSDQIQFDVQYSEWEFVRGMMHNLDRAERNWFSIIATAASLIASFGFIYWYVFRSAGPISTNDVIITSVVIVSSIPVAIGLHRFRPSIESQWSNMYKENPILKETYHVTIDAEGINSHSASIVNNIRWEVFSEAFESDDDFFFLISKQQPLFFPKRAFTPDQMIRVRRIASEMMGQRAKFLH